jgi:hypothetical protein
MMGGCLSQMTSDLVQARFLSALGTELTLARNLALDQTLTPALILPLTPALAPTRSGLPAKIRLHQSPRQNPQWHRRLHNQLPWRRRMTLGERGTMSAPRHIRPIPDRGIS